MPLLVLFLVVVSVSYQLFFRFEHWTSPNAADVVYERDNLTGEVHQFKPGQKIPLISRITGHYPSGQATPNRELPKNETLTAQHAGPIEHPTTLASAAPPVPVKHNTHQTSPQPQVVAMPAVAIGPVMASQHHLPEPTHHPVQQARGTTPPQYAENRVDLNQDGSQEKITLHKDPVDGLVDITVLDGQREVFYGRGKRLQMLANRRHGWADIALIGQQGQSLVFAYSPQQQAYVLAPSANPPEPAS